MKNKFGVGAVGARIGIINEIPEKLGAADALNLAAHPVACALGTTSNPEAGLESVLSDVAEAAGEGALALRIREELA